MKKQLPELMILFVVLCISGIASAAGEPVCLVISPTDAGVNDPVTISAYDGSDNWVDLRDYTVLEICFDDGLCIFSGGGIDVSSGDGVFTLTSAILAGYKFDCDFWNSNPPPDSTWFTLVNPSEGNPAFESIAEAIAAGGDCDLGEDTTPPTPDPMTWSSAPAAVSSSQIDMTATTATDPSGVQYFFDETTSGPGATDSGWQSGAGYSDTGLDADTQYCYRVQARDMSANQNTTAWSTTQCATTQAGGWTQIQYDDFEGGFGNWNDGGLDCLLYTEGTYAHQGNNAADLQDDTSTSVMTTDNLALSSYSEVKVDFWYICISMDKSTEDFWLQISTNGGSSFDTVEEWNLGDEFVNGTFYPDSVTITGYTLTNQTQIRFRCDASGNKDDVYIDEVVISAQ